MTDHSFLLYIWITFTKKWTITFLWPNCWMKAWVNSLQNNIKHTWLKWFFCQSSPSEDSPISLSKKPSLSSNTLFKTSFIWIFLPLKCEFAYVCHFCCQSKAFKIIVSSHGKHLHFRFVIQFTINPPSSNLRLQYYFPTGLILIIWEEYLLAMD